MLEAAAATADPAEVYAVTHKALASAITVIAPDFSVAINLLNKHARELTDDRTQQRLDILEQWKKAGRLDLSA